MTESIGTARLDIVVDTSNFDAGVTKAKRSTQDLANAAQQAQGSMEAGTKRQIASLERQIATLGKSRDEIIRWRIEQQTSGKVAAELTAKLDAQVTRLNGSNKAFNQFGLTAKQNAAALRGLPAQLTDIATALGSGQRPLTVLLQQGGQLKDMFGGIVPAARALGGAVVGFINPMTLAAAAVGALGVAWKQGADEGHAFNRALILTGGYAGKTAEQLQAMSAQLAGANVTQGQAAETLAQVAASGKFTAEQLGLVTDAALQMQVATGKAVEETVAQFASLADEPTRAVVKLNDQYHFLTVSVYDQIKALEAQGRTQDAATLAIETFGRVSAERAKQAAADADWITKSWVGVKSAIAGAFDTLRNFGRLQSEVGKASYNIAQARQQLLTISGRLQKSADDGTATNAQVTAAKARIKQLQALISQEQKVLAGDPSAARAARTARQQQANDLLIQVREITESHASAEQKRGKRIAQEIGLADQAILQAQKTGNDALIAQAKAAKAALLKAQTEEKAATPPRSTGGGGRTTRGSAVSTRTLPEINAGAAQAELDRLAAAEARATESFKDMEAQLQGPMAVAIRDHAKRVAELNALAAQSPEAAERLAAALELEAKRHAEVAKEIEAQQNPLKLLLDDMAFELDLIGKSNAERAVMVELRRQNIDAMSAEGRAAIETAKQFDEEAKAKQRSIDLMDDFRQGAADALADFVTGAKSAKEAFADFFDDLARRITQMIAERWIEQAFGAMGSDGSGTSGGGWISAIAGLFANAKGNVFQGGNVMAFANGGVVGGPTFFPMTSGRTGLMGEAGPEAIVPLHRGPDGKLGIRMERDSQAAGRGVTVQQAIYVTGTVSPYAAAQMQQEAARKQRIATSRNG